MSREYCQRCKYPLKTCVCSSIKEVNIRTKVFILQHPREKKHAKSTVRLLCLLSPKIEVISTTNHKKIEQLLKTLDKHTTALLYPNATSIALDNGHEDQQFDRIKTLLLIDGTWSQAYSIFHNNKYLQTIRSYHFSNPPAQKFAMRKAKKKEQLSTLEAVSYSLLQIEGLKQKPFLDLFNAMQSHWLRYLSDSES